LSRSRLAIWNYLSAMLFTAFTLVGLIVTRYVIAWLGEERAGAARMVVDWVGYFTIFEIGMSSTLAPLLARVLGRDDKIGLEATVSAGIRAFLVLLGLCLVIAVGMLAIVGWLIPVSPGNQFDLRLAWCVAMIGLVPMVLSPFRALADARQQGYRINLALTAQSLLIFSLSLGFAAMGFGITGQVAASTFAALPLAIFLTRDGLKAFPGLLRAARTTRPDAEVWQAISKLGFATILLALSGRMSLLTDSLVVGKILGPSLAIQLVVTLRLTSLMQSQLQGIGNASWAALAELHAEGRKDEFNRRLIELTGLVSVFGLAALGPIVAYSKYFVALWIRTPVYLGDGLVLLGAINAFLLGLISLWFWCFAGTGRVREMLPMALLGAFLNVGASILLTMVVGPIGPLLGTLISFVGLSLWYIPICLRRDFGTSVASLYLAACRPLVLGVPYAAFLYSIASVHRPWGWPGLVAEMGLSTLFFLAISFRFVLGPTDRAAWTMRVRGLVARRA